MKNLVTKYCKWQWLVFLIGGLCFPSCKDDDEGNIPPYNPEQPIELDTFHPKTGPIGTTVILTGKNFGNNADSVKVYFNQKRASIISAKGDRILTLAPKLPGEECIISVVIGKDSVAYNNEIFDYIIQTNISTLIGGDKTLGDDVFPNSSMSLAEVLLGRKPETPFAIDDEDNLYFCHDIGGGAARVHVISEAADRLRPLAGDFAGIFTTIIIGYNTKTGNPYALYGNGAYHAYKYWDRSDDFSDVTGGNIEWDNDAMGSGAGAKRLWVMNPSDEKFYTRTYDGYFGRFDPETGKGENLTFERSVGGSGDTSGIAFDPRDNNILYFSVSNQHCIYKYNLEDHTYEVYAGRQGSAGHLDGIMNEAQFNNPHQICIDSENNMYIADRDNHCIRRISLETGYVSTVAGTPGQAGYVNGTADVAQFDKPMCIAVTSDGILYIGDSENKAIRRLAIE